ncbi:MAG TPA: DcaP family trimeric outer membrane transporter [Allosphingosinicella sp.]|nr:DcaP family trimeric outer membrane transporter [Allosphingosinicella sp.]
MSEALIATMLVLASPPDAAAQGPIDPTPPPAVQAPTSEQARAAEPATDRTDDWLNLQNNSNADVHHLEIYGFAQFDAIQDFNRVHPDWAATLRPSRIPTLEGQYGSDGQSIFSVRQSRFGVRGDGEMAGRDYEVKFEFDMYGVGGDAGQTTIRLRHAYGRWGPILAGQTNSLFMDGDLFPNVVDYWGPNGMVFLRTPQLRFTFVNSGGWTAAVALEHATGDIDTGNIRLIDSDLATNIRNNEELPDFTAMVRYQGDWGHIQLSGLLRKIGYDTLGTVDNEPQGSELGWGVMLGGAFKWGIATLRVGGVYGEGIASYMNDGGMDLAPSAALLVAPPIFPPPPVPFNQLGEAEAVPLLGITAYLDLQWTPTLSSAIGYSLVEVDNTNFQDATAFHRGEYASANLLWAPGSRLLLGPEILWGQRTDNDGASGDDIRLQFSFKISFSSDQLWAN